MWDKNLDEGIFLCDHNSHILTAKFLRSLEYVNYQLEYGHWHEPNEFILDETDQISYILLSNKNFGKILGKEVRFQSSEIELTNRQKNEILQGG